jgi:hypothetical protein
MREWFCWETKTNWPRLKQVPCGRNCAKVPQSDDHTQAHNNTAYTLPEQTAVLHVSRRFDASSGIGQWAKLINEGQHEALKEKWQALPITGQLPSDRLRRKSSAGQTHGAKDRRAHYIPRW